MIAAPTFLGGQEKNREDTEKGWRKVKTGLKRFYVSCAQKLLSVALCLSFLAGGVVLAPLTASASEDKVGMVSKGAENAEKKVAGKKAKKRVVRVRKVSARKAPRGSRVRIFAGGNGSAKRPWTIRTAAQLRAFAQSVNKGNSYAGKRIRLTSDIDLSGAVWSPIGFHKEGTASRPFKGIFDGNGRTVYGLRVSSPASGAAGLFGALDGASVLNLNIDEASVSGGTEAGALAGFAFKSEVRNCVASGQVSGGDGVGGLIGSAAKSRFDRLSFSGTVTASGSNAGGAVGLMAETVLSRVSVRGKVQGKDGVGGMAGGIIAGELRDSEGILLAVEGNKNVGGLVGSINRTGVLRKVVFDGEVSGKENTGGLVGWVESGVLTDCDVAGAVLGWERTGGVSGVWSDGTARRCVVRAFVSGTAGVGGFSGRMSKGIADRCEMQGDVEGGDAVGGLVGSMGSGKLEKCAVFGGVRGVLASGREIGKSMH